MGEQLRAATMEGPTPGAEEQALRGGNLLSQVADRLLHNKAVRTGVAALAIAAGGEAVVSGVNAEESLASAPPVVAPDCKTAQTPFSTGGQTNNGNIINKTCTIYTYRVGNSSVSESQLAKANFVIRSNGKAMSKAQIHRLKKAGKCDEVGKGTDTPWFKNAGYGGQGYGWDHRFTEICLVNGVWRSTRCNNKVVKPKHVPEHPVQALFVRGAARTELKVEAASNSHAEASATCPGSYGFGMGDGSSRGSAEVSLKVLARARSKAKRVKAIRGQARISAEGSAKASANSRAAAAAYCVNNQTFPVKVNHLPFTDEVRPQHILVNGEQQICEFESDPDNDIVSRNFSKTGNGNFISFVYPGNEPGEYCIDFKAGTTAGPNTVTAKVTDAANNTATDTEAFDTVDAGKF